MLASNDSGIAAFTVHSRTHGRQVTKLDIRLGPMLRGFLNELEGVIEPAEINTSEFARLDGVGQCPPAAVPVRRWEVIVACGQRQGRKQEQSANHVAREG